MSGRIVPDCRALEKNAVYRTLLRFLPSKKFEFSAGFLLLLLFFGVFCFCFFLSFFWGGGGGELACSENEHTRPVARSSQLSWICSPPVPPRGQFLRRKKKVWCPSKQVQPVLMSTVSSSWDESGNYGFSLFLSTLSPGWATVMERSANSKVQSLSRSSQSVV